MISQPQEPSAFCKQRPVGPAMLPSSQIRREIPGCGPHFWSSQVSAIASAGLGGSRQLDRSQRSSGAQFESTVQTPRACLQVQGPLQASLPSQTTSSPALQFG
jgi:hypothetical protein